MVLGEDLAVQLGAFVGDEVTLVTPQGRLSPMGIIPRQMRLRVVGIFNLGLYEFDTSYGFVSLNVARRLLRRNQADFIQLRVDDIYKAPEIRDLINLIHDSTFFNFNERTNFLASENDLNFFFISSSSSKLFL